MMFGLRKNIPTSITPAIAEIFLASDVGVFIVPKLQSSIRFPFSVMNGYPRSSVRIVGLPPIFLIAVSAEYFANGCISTGTFLFKYLENFVLSAMITIFRAELARIFSRNKAPPPPLMRYPKPNVEMPQTTLQQSESKTEYRPVIDTPKPDIPKPVEAKYTPLQPDVDIPKQEPSVMPPKVIQDPTLESDTDLEDTSDLDKLKKDIMKTLEKLDQVEVE